MKSFRARLLVVMLIQMFILALFPLSTLWMERGSQSVVLDGEVYGTSRSWAGTYYSFGLDIRDISWDLVEKPVPAYVDGWPRDSIIAYVVLVKAEEKYDVSRVTWSKPTLAPGEVMLIGRTYDLRSPKLWVNYDLNRFYVSENERMDWHYPTKNAQIELLVTPNGYARVKEIVIK